MPKVRVDLVKGARTSEEKMQLLDIIHDSLVKTIGIPVEDRFQILAEHKPENYYIPYGLSSRYVNIDIIMYPGRAEEAKRKLINLIKERLAAQGCKVDEVMITLHDPPLSNWG